ncbi:ATP-grasp domain-containing protein [Shimia sp. CNT1-13L.2]|uniref:acetate--CoA ligase family protein n=1 Tax=Shimia sp. CNT1-13L.2 TaxID=2959663 RepID=UPI0020CF273D|nr:acetate--CoA ligase family protein [Shimia sp. CNT1-13L.2]MCP9482667.1 ATP-grasp domain-containing protein [Shimia sp. CNT1-13L.2]
MKIKTRVVRGYAYGFPQPCLLVAFDEKWREGSLAVDRLFEHVSSTSSRHVSMFALDPGYHDELQQTSAGRFTLLLDQLNTSCGDQRFSSIRSTQPWAVEEEVFFCLAVPSLAPMLVRENIEALVAFASELRGNDETLDWDAFCSRRATRARAFLPGGTNAGNFIAAAVERNIPYFQFSPQLILLGYGSGTRVLNSSVTDKESVIGFEIANNKRLTNRLLRLAGFPVARQAVVSTREQVIVQAEAIGYPLVLKPATAEQGHGVVANLSNREQLQNAFEALSKTRNDLVLEAFVPGKLFRINVFDGNIMRVAERIPAMIVGDGRHTVSQLIEALNSESDRGGRNSTKHRLVIDADVHATLERQGLRLESMPEHGLNIALTSLARVNNGGTARDARADFHHENLKMLKEATETVGLQMAGIDFLCVDPAKPWYETGAVICEINSKPQLGVSHPEIYGQVIDMLGVGCPPVRLLVSNEFTEMEAPIFNRGLKRIELRASPDHLLRHGLPTQYCSEIEHLGDVTEDQVRRLDDFFGLAVHSRADL